MPLLKKTFKGNLSQTSKTAGFKAPIQQKRKIKDIIEDELTPEMVLVGNIPQQQQSQEFVSQKSLNGSRLKGKENVVVNRKDKEAGQSEENDTSDRIADIIDESFSSYGCLSQEALNEPVIKAAYLDFINRGGIKNSFDTCSDEDIDSMIEDILEDSKELFGEGEADTFASVKPSENQKPKKKRKTEKNKSKTLHALIRLESSENEGTSSRLAYNEKNKRKTSKSKNSQELQSNSQMNKRKVIPKVVIEPKVRDLKSNCSTEEPVLKQENRFESNDVVRPEKVAKRNPKIIKQKMKKRNKSVSRTASDEEFPGLSLYEKMELIYDNRNVGLYVLCDKCDKARYLPDVVDPLDLPDKWYCSMNPDVNYNKCSDAEHVEEDEDFLIENLYNAGSIVFVKMDGYPWWPAMVDDDPDTETYFWLEGESKKPTWYHVTFFDSSEVSRAWIKQERTKPFKKNLKGSEFQIKNDYVKRLKFAFEQAKHALDLPLIERLRQYGFLKRYQKNKQEKPKSGKKIKFSKQRFEY